MDREIQGGQDCSEPAQAALEKPHPPRLRELDYARTGRQPLDAGNDGTCPAEGDDIGVIKGRYQFRSSCILGPRQLCYADRPAQMRIVEREAREFAENRLLALKLGFGQFAAVSTRTDDREADVHGRFDTRVCARSDG